MMDLETLRALQQRGRFFYEMFPARARQRNGCSIVTNSSASMNTTRIRRRLPRMSRATSRRTQNEETSCCTTRWLSDHRRTMN